jgi:formate dehydrogenase maturation protein FdhE
MTATLAASGVTYQRRRERARELAERWPHSAEVLRLYGSLLDVQERAAQAATAAGPAFGDLPRWIAEAVVPAVVHVTAAVGPDALVSSVQGLVYRGEVAGTIAAWLAGQELSLAERYLARAASAPVLEALPGILPPPSEPSSTRCPECGAPPQLAVFTAGGDALVTGQRMLECSRCPGSWAFPRMVCAGCGEYDTRKLPIYADHEAFPHLRVDGCASCGQYLLTVELAKDARAVPVVDELAAIPLDLYARDRGLRKVTPNLMGF